MSESPLQLNADLLKFFQSDPLHQSHPVPAQLGIKSLYKFYSHNLKDKKGLEYGEYLFLKGRLHHSSPFNFNDPFECKPHFNLPQEPLKLGKVIDYLKSLYIGPIDYREQFEKKLSVLKNMPVYLRMVAIEALNKTFREINLCCFTEKEIDDPEGILLWSHYADGHKGFCVEFDSTTIPLNLTHRIVYTEVYPEADFPLLNDLQMLVFLLTKSYRWKYEQEFRSIIVKDDEYPFTHDNDSIFLRGDEIKNVYLGNRMEDENKKDLINLIKKGPFNPGIWETRISDSEYSLKFKQIM